MRGAVALVLTSLATLVALPSQLGCIALPSDVPTDARIGCQSVDDCPQGWICRELIGECRSPEGLDETPPELVDVELGPTLALRGAEVTLSFAVSEPLFAPPTVTLEGRPFAPGGSGDAGASALGADGRFHFTYVADGTEPQGEAADVVVSLIDHNGVGNDAIAGTLSFDFNEPTVTSAITLEPDDGWLAADETLRIAFSLSEELPAELAPVVTLTTPAGDALVPVLESQNGSSYVYAYTPLGNEDEVTYGVAIDMADAAGNTSQADGPRVTFDFTPPAVDNVFLRYTPDANNPIPSAFLAAGKSGTGITLRITATEPLHEDSAQVGVLELTGVLPTPTFAPRQALETLAPPPLMNGPPGITAAAEDNRLLIEGTFNDASPTGLYFLEVVWSDLAGNTVTLTLEDPDVTSPADRAVAIVVRNDPPQLYVEQSLVRVVFAPWGTRPPSNDDEQAGEADDVRELLGVDMVQTSGGMLPWEVRLPAGPHVALTPDDPLAVQAGIDANAFTFTPRVGDLLALFADDPVIQLVVYVDDNGPEIGRVGRLNYFPGVTDERWLRTELPLLPFERLYVTGIDLAGNESQRVPLEQAQWVAHPGQSAFFGEQAIAAFSARATAAVTPRLDESALTIAPPDPSADRIWDAAVPEAQLGAAFREIASPPVSPLPRFGGSVAYDAVRGELVMFGSEAVGTDTADTWVFDGRVWDDVTPDGPSPSPRVFPGLAFDAVRGRTLMFGGTVLGAVNPDDLWEWDGASWSQRYVDPNLPRPAGRFGHTLVFDPAGERMLLLGGANFGEPTGCGTVGGQAFFCDLWAWDGASWSQLATTGDDPGPRAFASAAVDQARGVLVLWRGDPGADDPLLDVNDTWELDLSTLTWTRFDLPDGGAPIAPVNPAFFHPGLGRVAALAARTPAVGDPRWELITWNGATWVSSLIAPTEGQPALGRVQSMVSYLPTDDRVFVASGFPAEGEPPLGDDHLTFLIGADDDAWQVRDPTPGDIYPARNLASLSWDASRGVAVLTGGGEVVPGGLVTGAPLPNDLFELMGDRWVQRPVAPGPRVGGASAFVPAADETMVFGGIDSVTLLPGGQASLTYTDETLTWDGATLSAATPTSSPTPRYGQAAATAPMGGALLFGGYDGALAYNDLWAFNGADWTSIAVAGPSPSPRVNAAMVLDEARDEVLLMGGYVLGPSGFEPSDETWVFDGTSWEQRDAPGPSARALHTMAFDVQRQRPILFGGLGDNFAADVWEWNGDAWLPVNATVPPLYRMGHGLVYDRDRGRLITAAGLSQNLIFQSTTFERASPTFDDVPAMTFVAPATLTSFARERITAVTVRARCSGVFDEGGVEATGAELFVWDAAAAEPDTGSWRPVASSSSGPAEPLGLMAVTEEGAAAQRLFVERDRQLALQCRPAGPSGQVVGRVASSFAEIRVSYDLP